MSDPPTTSALTVMPVSGQVMTMRELVQLARYLASEHPTLFAYYALPVAQYPEVAPPTVVVSASYPGASAETVAETVATPLEQEINGVENMLYMVSQSTGDGNVQITVQIIIPHHGLVSAIHLVEIGLFEI